MSKPGLVISECLENLEDTKFTNHAEVFNALILILQEKNCDVAPKEVVRILAALEKCMEDEVQSIPLALSVVLSLLTNVQVCHYLLYHIKSYLYCKNCTYKSQYPISLCPYTKMPFIHNMQIPYIPSGFSTFSVLYVSMN